VQQAIAIYHSQMIIVKEILKSTGVQVATKYPVIKKEQNLNLRFALSCPIQNIHFPNRLSPIDFNYITMYQLYSIHPSASLIPVRQGIDVVESLALTDLTIMSLAD